MYFGGDVKGESAINTEEEIGGLIDYEFKVIIIVCLSQFLNITLSECDRDGNFFNIIPPDNQFG